MLHIRFSIDGADTATVGGGGASRWPQLSRLLRVPKTPPFIIACIQPTRLATADTYMGLVRWNISYRVIDRSAQGFMLTVLFLVPGLAQAQRKFNPHTQQWDVAPRNATPQYNPYSGEFEMRQPRSVLRFNHHEGKWQLAPRDAVPRFNHDTGKWELGPAKR